LSEITDREVERERRYLPGALLTNLRANRAEAQVSAKSQVTVSLSSLRKQQRRPALMEYYDKVAEFDGARIDEIESFRGKGGKVVGFFCLFPPIELIRASGATPIRTDSGLYCAVGPSEQLLPSDVCPLVKSALGTKILQLSPYLELCDALICPSSCGMKAKLGELLEDFMPIWRIEVPSYKDNSWARSSWQVEIRSLKANLEKLTGEKITGQALRHSIMAVQEARTTFRRLIELRKSRFPPISGRDAMLVTQTVWYDDLDRWTVKTAELCNELEDRIKTSLSVSGPEAPRIMLSGSPIVWPNWKLPNLIEESGGLIVCDELCSGNQGTLSESVNLEEWTMNEMLAALADRYLRPVTCPCFSPNDKRMDKLRRLTEDFDVDGVVYHQLKGCYAHKIEFGRIRNALKKLRIPVLGIETDYTQEDLGQLRTRIEAFLEMLQSAQQDS
jgi:benzoyl-CoA reductase/2-hydroxyglutaryl-CoA dehydratase subunit BcrC/BadD/HgdB